jgi:predicted component of type VI protein secretion system
MLAGLTAEEIRDAADELYGPDGFRNAPAQIFLDQFEAADPPTTFLRVAFDRFTYTAARKLTQLGAMLQEPRRENANVVFVVYFGRIEPMEMATRSIQMADR